MEYIKLKNSDLRVSRLCMGGCPMGGYGGGFHTWLFYPEGLYNFDEKYGKAPYESETGRHPYGS